MRISGGCRCGNISFVLTLEPAPAELPARACSCSFCTTHDGVWTSHPSGVLKVNLREPERVSIHTFATGTAQFHICGACGAVPVVTSRIDGRLYAVVNVNAFGDIGSVALRSGSANFDGESEEARLARRRRNWIADVEFVNGPT